MKNNILIIAAALLLGQQGMAQTLRDVLSRVEEVNPALAAARLDVEADRQQNLSESALEALDFEFNYLWGQDKEIGNRHDLRVTQSVDMATLTGARRRQAASRTELSELDYRSRKREVLLEASQVCMELVYLESMIEQMQRHLKDCSSLVRATGRKVELGDESVLELGKARLHETSVKGELETLLLERKIRQDELSSLAGGESIAFDAGSFVPGMLPSDFETWFAQSSENSPALQYVRKSREVQEQQLSIEKAAALPSLNFGYMSELGLTDRYRGFTVGMSIPLWSNQRKVKEAKARSQASSLRERDVENRFYYSLSSLYAKSLRQAELASDLRSALELSDNRARLLEAQMSGEISMLDYLQEMDLYYDTLRQCLEAERDYNLSLAELESYLIF